MRITEEYFKDQIVILTVVSAKYTGNFIIDLIFSDGCRKKVDFKPFLESSLHPSIRKYLDEDLFKRYEIIDGNLNWNDYDLIFPINDLYNGEI